MTFLYGRRGAARAKTGTDTPSRNEAYTAFGELVSIKCSMSTLYAEREIRDIKEIYEPFLASRVVPRSGRCLDVSAGPGWFAIPFAKAFKDWTVVCLEADKEQFHLLQANVKNLGLQNVVCINAALHPGTTTTVETSAILRGDVPTVPGDFRRLMALSPKLAPVLAGSNVAIDEVISLNTLPLDLIGSLAPDLIRVDAPGCEAAIAEALQEAPSQFMVGRLYPYVPSRAFFPKDIRQSREFYLVHGEHVLRRDYEDSFSSRNPRLDVVVAMYNARNFIQECVDSVLSDGNPHIRVIVVDDGSTDGSGDVVDQIYLGNPRVRLLRKANGGCASARNHGRRNSDSSHIAFIDADDRVDPGMFTALFETARFTGASVVEGEFKTFTTGPNGLDEFKPSYEADLYPHAGFHRLADWDYDWFPSSQILTGQPTIWRRVHRRDFLDRKKIWFPEHVRAFDDQIFQLLVGQYAGTIAHVYNQFYHYRQHPAQDIKQGDERHFYSYNMFRAVFQRALDEGWHDVTPIVRSLLNTMRWSYGGLREDLKQIYADAAVEFLAVINKTFGTLVTPEHAVDTQIPGIDYLLQRRVQEMANVPTSYAMMRLESWRWQPEFIRMMASVT